MGLEERSDDEKSERELLLEAIEERGHEGMVIDHLKCDIVMDDKGPSMFYKGEKLSHIDAVIPRIGA